MKRFYLLILATFALTALSQTTARAQYVAPSDDEWERIGVLHMSNDSLSLLEKPFVFGTIDDGDIPVVVKIDKKMKKRLLLNAGKPGQDITSDQRVLGDRTLFFKIVADGLNGTSIYVSKRMKGHGKKQKGPVEITLQ